MISQNPDTFIGKVDWAWPKMEELDENSHQDAVEKKLRNMTGSYKEILGSSRLLDRYRKKRIEIKTKDFPLDMVHISAT